MRAAPHAKVARVKTVQLAPMVFKFTNPSAKNVRAFQALNCLSSMINALRYVETILTLEAPNVMMATLLVAMGAVVFARLSKTLLVMPLAPVFIRNPLCLISSM